MRSLPMENITDVEGVYMDMSPIHSLINKKHRTLEERLGLFQDCFFSKNLSLQVSIFTKWTSHEIPPPPPSPCKTLLPDFQGVFKKKGSSISPRYIYILHNAGLLFSSGNKLTIGLNQTIINPFLEQVRKAHIERRIKSPTHPFLRSMTAVCWLAPGYEGLWPECPCTHAWGPWWPRTSAGRLGKSAPPTSSSTSLWKERSTDMRDNIPLFRWWCTSGGVLCTLYLLACQARESLQVTRVYVVMFVWHLLGTN